MLFTVASDWFCSEYEGECGGLSGGLLSCTYLCTQNVADSFSDFKAERFYCSLCFSLKWFVWIAQMLFRSSFFTQLQNPSCCFNYPMKSPSPSPLLKPILSPRYGLELFQSAIPISFPPLPVLRVYCLCWQVGVVKGFGGKALSLPWVKLEWNDSKGERAVWGFWRF